MKLNPNKQAHTSTGAEPTESDQPPPKKSQTFVIHRQEGITGDTGTLWDKSERQKTKGHKVDELASHEALSVEAMRVLQTLASEFLEECFNRELVSSFIVN